MAKKKKRKYSPSSGSDVKSEMHRYKSGTAKSGRGGKGGKDKESHTSDRNRPIKGAQKGQERTKEEIGARIT